MTGYLTFSINGVNVTFQKDNIVIGYRYADGASKYEFMEVGSADLSTALTIPSSATIILKYEMFGSSTKEKNIGFGSLWELYTYLKSQHAIKIEWNETPTFFAEMQKIKDKRSIDEEIMTECYECHKMVYAIKDANSFDIVNRMNKKETVAICSACQDRYQVCEDHHIAYKINESCPKCHV